MVSSAVLILTFLSQRWAFSPPILLEIYLVGLEDVRKYVLLFRFVVRCGNTGEYLYPRFLQLFRYIRVFYYFILRVVYGGMRIIVMLLLYRDH